MKLLLIIFVLLHLSSLTYANNDIQIQKIKLSGLTKTKKNIVLNELTFTEGSIVNHDDINNSITNLRNTNLFSDVSYKLNGADNNNLHINFTERWTTIPIFKYSSGGGVGQLTLGVYDPNILGHYIESGIQYQRLGETNSGVIWFKNPRLFGKKQGIDVQAWLSNRLRTKYEQGVDEPIIKTGFLHERKKLYLNYFKEFDSEVTGHFSYEYNNDTFSTELLEEDVKQKAIAFGLPKETEVHFIGLGVDYGKLNYNNFKVDGFLTELRLRYGLASTKETNNFLDADLSLLYYNTLKWDITFAQRFLTGITTTDILQYWKYLGGLDRVRGFSDNRFAGKYYWLSNTELRVPLYRHKWVVIQGVSFLDLVGTSDRSKYFTNLEGASAGAGLRLFLPKVYRFVLRFDFAQPIKRDDDLKFSFGVQQFF